MAGSDKRLPHLLMNLLHEKIVMRIKPSKDVGSSLLNEVISFKEQR